MSRWLSIGKTAERLALRVDTVRPLERAGKIRAAKTRGGHRRFREDEVARFLATRQRPGRKRQEGARLRRRTTENLFDAPATYPSGASSIDVRTVSRFVEEKIEAAVRPLREQLARLQRQADDAERRKDILIQQGMTYLQTETASWEWSEQREARAEVETAIKKRVKGDWEVEEVQDLVDDLLGEWDDEEEE